MTTRKPQINPRSTGWVLFLAAVASVMAALDAMVVSTALTTIRLDLGASIEQLEWTVNAYNLTLAVLLLPAAALGDRFGRRRMFTVGLALFVVASAACALAPDAGAGSYASPEAFTDGFAAAIAVSAALSVVGAIAGLGLPGRHERAGAATGRPQPVAALAAESRS